MPRQTPGTEVVVPSRLEPANAAQITLRPQGTIDCRALSIDKINGEAHWREGQQQVRKENRGIHLDPADRLQCHFGSQIGCAAEF